MIKIGSVLNVADNSGAKTFKVIGIPGHSVQSFASIGDVVTASVYGAASAGIVKDHSVVQVVIVRVRKEIRRKDGSYIRFDDNAGVVVDKDKQIIGTRIFGPIAREVRDLGFVKIASLAKEVW